jgi:hypothetical protein
LIEQVRKGRAIYLKWLVEPSIRIGPPEPVLTRMERRVKFR